VSYLPERYPTLFERTETGMRNNATNEDFNITQRPLAEDPMQMAARMVQDDLAIMVEREDGEYHFLAGAVLLAGFWRLEDKFGMSLSDIHTSGDVPGFKEKLEKGMMNFFRRLKPESPVLRNNYFIQVDDKLAWSESIGDEDSAGIGWFTVCCIHFDCEAIYGFEIDADGLEQAEENKAIEHHWFRSERQSLRRYVYILPLMTCDSLAIAALFSLSPDTDSLPRTGAIVFTIRTYFQPVTSICNEPYVPGRLASAVRSWGDDVSRYKGKEKYGRVLLEYLDKRHEEQVQSGLIGEGEEEEEGGKRYPF
jgi:alpha-1,2-mannosyltransferase